MDDLTEQAYQKAIEVLHECIDPLGVKASALASGYTQVWARDSMITLLGAVLLDEPAVRSALQNSLQTLGNHQADSGCIPSNVDVTSRKVDFRAYMDGNAWFIIGHYLLSAAVGTTDFFEKSWPQLHRTCEWLLAQDVFQSGLLAQQEGTDWMDHMAVRGRGLYTNALSCKALQLAADLSRKADHTENAAKYAGKAEEIRSAIRKLLWMDLETDLQKHDLLNEEYEILAGHKYSLVRERPYFLPYIGFREIGVWFDSLGNLLSILFGIADERQTTLILDYIEQVGVDSPYPLKSLYRAIHPGDRDWRDYYFNRNLNIPHHYHNGGIWPFIGGFYVAALVKAGRLDSARQQLSRLAAANRAGKAHEWEFNEWLHGETGRAMGRELQAWSAGMYLYAYHCVERQAVLHFG